MVFTGMRHSCAIIIFDTERKIIAGYFTIHNSFWISLCLRSAGQFISGGLKNISDSILIPIDTVALH